MTSGGNVDADGKVYGLGRFAAEKLIPFYGDPLKGQKDKKIRVSFNADCSDALPWKFTPLQKSVVVRPGESALAFYTAKNKSDKDIIGIATYNVTPNNVCRSVTSEPPRVLYNMLTNERCENAKPDCTVFRQGGMLLLRRAAFARG